MIVRGQRLELGCQRVAEGKGPGEQEPGPADARKDGWGELLGGFNRWLQPRQASHQERHEEAVQVAVVLAWRFCIAIFELSHQLAHAPAGRIQISGQAADMHLCAPRARASWGASGIAPFSSLLACATSCTCAGRGLRISLNQALVLALVLVPHLTC